MPGTTGYCDEQAAAVIRRRLKDQPAEGIHFLDNGNYHYLSYFWLEKLKGPVDLLVFDHHSDMLQPVFGDIMSCGSWLLRTVQDLPLVRKVMIFGIDPDYVGHVPQFLRNRVTTADREEEMLAFLKARPKVSLYISLDKDVFSTRDVRTNWDQGRLRYVHFERLLAAADRIRKIVGMDVCGESTQYGEQWHADGFNKKLARLIQSTRFAKQLQAK
ncbi:arginase family protein [Pseudoramibacter porci]|uniref:Arginase family protein n=1 Tax=Pseudoramibacter porci TaxID=2606631 RepID=A0A7X2NHH8_9FIRM|nr:arginase family protein [Pseudoramibacter porci]MSS20625.1 arginase family protein [Pseudoramibacter porci]